MKGETDLFHGKYCITHLKIIPIITEKHYAFCISYRLIPPQYMLGEKEKSKVMQRMESKLMKAIREVNESEVSSAEPLPITGGISVAATASQIHTVTRYKIHNSFHKPIRVNILNSRIAQ